MGCGMMRTKTIVERKVQVEMTMDLRPWENKGLAPRFQSADFPRGPLRSAWQHHKVQLRYSGSKGSSEQSEECIPANRQKVLLSSRRSPRELADPPKSNRVFHLSLLLLHLPAEEAEARRSSSSSSLRLLPPALLETTLSHLTFIN